MAGLSGRYTPERVAFEERAREAAKSPQPEPEPPRDGPPCPQCGYTLDGEGRCDSCENAAAYARLDAEEAEGGRS